MGCEQGQENERPVHRVRLDRFGLAKFPVTNSQYLLFLDATGAAAAAILVRANVCRSAKTGGGRDLGRSGCLLPLARWPRRAAVSFADRS